MNSDKNLVLIGMPAVGKSTVGVLLAKRLGYLFVDTDLLIQAGELRSLQDILDTEGVKRFRETEERYVLSLSCTRHVIATGGSVVYSQKAMARLKESGVVVFLDIGLDSLKQRLDDIRARGVVMDPGQTLEDLHEKRRPLYLAHAQVIVNCQGLTPDQTVTRVMKARHDWEK